MADEVITNLTHHRSHLNIHTLLVGLILIARLSRVTVLFLLLVSEPLELIVEEPIFVHHTVHADSEALLIDSVSTLVQTNDTKANVELVGTILKTDQTSYMGMGLVTSTHRET